MTLSQIQLDEIKRRMEIGQRIALMFTPAVGIFFEITRIKSIWNSDIPNEYHVVIEIDEVNDKKEEVSQNHD